MSEQEQHEAPKLQRRDTDLVAEQAGLPLSIAEPTLVTYRSIGIGMFGVVMRFAGMPLEKIALFMNSSQVSGSGQLQQAARLTFKDGMLAPYRVVGPASITAWFFQYSVMGLAFQFFDHGLSNLLGVKPVYYGNELMLPRLEDETSATDNIKYGFKTLVSPIFSAAIETKVSNRAEVQRFFGLEKFASIEKSMNARSLSRVAGPAFAPGMMRNFIMCQTTFIITPITYKLYFPQERKSNRSLFWFGLGMNIFVGNVAAITQQSLWGRSLDYLGTHGKIEYKKIISESYKRDGAKAFFTGPKWFSRVLMNAPAQGVLPWFYNEVLPIGEPAVMNVVKQIYEMRFKDIRRNATADTKSPTS
mmetsp:Transcript_22226/g.61935  ORF Transcript_22226/g.61935 Transcript_22226/m.61935 type:complete len:359 (-) Transcript_22226:1548-2624(-)